jgi:hypothetical protein
MKDMIGYYKNDIFIANMWLPRDIMINKKYLLIQRLLINPDKVKIIDDKLAIELNHKNIYSPLNFYEYNYFTSGDPIKFNNYYYMSIDLANNL